MTRLVMWSLALVTGLVAMHHLSLPAGTQPAVAAPAFAAMRVFALGLGWYLVVVLAVGCASRLSHAVAAVRIADVLTVPAVRSLLNRATGFGLAMTITLSAPMAVAATASPVVTAAVARPAADTAPVMHLIDDAPAPVPAPAAPPATWTVSAGQNLWLISSHALSEHLHRRPSDAEVIPYWRALIDANRDRVADPSLIFVGQELRLPPR